MDTLEQQLDALEARLAETSGLTSAFESELAQMGRTLLLTNREVASLTSSFGSGLRRAFDGAIFGGLRFSDALKQVAASLSASVYNVAMAPIQNAMGGMLANGVNALFSGLFPGGGTAFSQKQVIPFTAADGLGRSSARGGVAGGGISAPAGTGGAMARSLGAGARPVSVVMNISTPDAQSFQRSQSQIAAQAARALSRGQRNR